jgi:hypothetical protein
MPLFGRRRQRVGSSPLAVTRGEVRSGRQRAITAAGLPVRRKDTEIIRRLIAPWQPAAFNYYDQVPEIKYAAQFYARMLSPLILYAAEYTDANLQDFVPTENQEAIDALKRIQDPGGGRTGLLGDYGRLMFLAGECYLFVSENEYQEEQWEFLSTDELRIQGGVYIRYKAPSLVAEEYQAPADEDEYWEEVEDKTAMAYRIWQRHPRYSYLADSTMQGVLEICEELVLLTKAVRARARNRAAGPGLLFMDDRISPAPPEATPDEDPEEDLFMSDLTEYLTAPIADEGSAAAAAPYLVRVPVGDENKTIKDMVYHLQLQDPMQLYPETGLRRECIERLAIGLDMPPEELLGVGDVNHWSAWMIDEKTWKAHGQPKAQQLCNDLTQTYFRRYLRDAVGMGDEANKYLIAYDASAIINHPDRAKDAKDLYDRGEIAGDSLREATGFDETDKPSTAELARYVGIKTRDSSLAWYGVPSVRQGGLEPAPGEILAPDTGVTGTPIESTGASDTTPGPPADRNTGDTTPPAVPPAPGVIGALNGGRSDQIAKVIGACDMALLRAREVAGARIRTAARRLPEIEQALDGVSNREVAATIGREGVQALRLSAQDLVANVRPLILDTLRLWRIEGEAAAMIAQHVERHAMRTLYDPNPRSLPDSFSVYLEELVVQNGAP